MAARDRRVTVIFFDRSLLLLSVVVVVIPSRSEPESTIVVSITVANNGKWPLFQRRIDRPTPSCCCCCCCCCCCSHYGICGQWWTSFAVVLLLSLLLLGRTELLPSYFFFGVWERLTETPTVDGLFLFFSSQRQEVVLSLSLSLSLFCFFVSISFLTALGVRLTGCHCFTGFT